MDGKEKKEWKIKERERKDEIERKLRVESEWKGSKPLKMLDCVLCVRFIIVFRDEYCGTQTIAM